MGPPNQTKQRGRRAKGLFTKETYNSRVYSSAWGPSLYFDKTMFDGDEPELVTITVEWETPSGGQKRSTTTQPLSTPMKETNNHAETDGRSQVTHTGRV